MGKQYCSILWKKLGLQGFLSNSYYHCNTSSVNRLQEKTNNSFLLEYNLPTKELIICIASFSESESRMKCAHKKSDYNPSVILIFCYTCCQSFNRFSV